MLTDAIDIANARIEFADGCIANVSASRVSQAPVRKLRVFRHDAYVSADLQEQRLRHVRKGAEGDNRRASRSPSRRSSAPTSCARRRRISCARCAAPRRPLVSGEQGRQALALALQVGRLVEERLARHGGLTFTKMEGAGNDFVVLDFTNEAFELKPEQIRKLADRHFGIGCDQVLVVEKAHRSRALDFRYRIFNADGGEVEQCGNGARCFVKFVHARGSPRSARSAWRRWAA